METGNNGNFVCFIGINTWDECSMSHEG